MKFIKEISENLLEEYRMFFKSNDYVLIKDILTDECINCFMNTITFNEETLKDKPQFGRKHNNDFGKLPIILEFQKETLEFYRKIIGEEYFATFAFAMEYIRDSEVLPHLDLICNEVSSTICYFDNGSYPLYLCKDYIENNYNHRYTISSSSMISSEKQIKMDIRCGDIGIFNGRNHLHWREKLNEDIINRGILSHYSYTKPGTEEYKIKISVDVPFENSVYSKIYNK
jgi:hypothetical protein